MRLLLLLNNWGAWKVADWLRKRDENIVGLVLQPPDDRRFADEILSTLDMPPDKIWLSTQLRDPNTLAALKELRPDIGISAFFGCILKPDMINMFPKGCINLHSALLPYNGGWHTNVWPIIEGTPAGVTIHYIDPGVDTGDIIAQRQIPVEPTDTGGSLHEKITRDQVELFKETWPLIREGKNSRTRARSFQGYSPSEIRSRQNQLHRARSHLPHWRLDKPHSRPHLSALPFCILRGG